MVNRAVATRRQRIRFECGRAGGKIVSRVSFAQIILGRTESARPRAADRGFPGLPLGRNSQERNVRTLISPAGRRTYLETRDLRSAIVEGRESGRESMRRT